MSRGKYEPTIALLKRGVAPDGSVSGEYPPVDNGDGCTTRGSVSIPDRRLGPYLGDLADGGTVVDLWACDWGAVAEVVCSGPMCDLALEPGTVRRFGDKVDRLMLEGTGGAFQAFLLRKVVNPGWSGLDYIALPEWLELRRGIGARIGRRDGQVIRWEDGTITPIQHESVRWSDSPVDACLARKEETTAAP